MKKSLILLLLIVTSSFTFQTAQAQSFPEMDVSPMDLAMARPNKKSPPMARVIYSRPQKKGRVIYGDIVPYGKVWRTGANEATELDIYTPLAVGKTMLKPGTYTIYTIPNENNWTIIINSETNVWGTVYEKNKDVVRFDVPVHDAAAPIESLSMIFRPDDNGTTLMIGWDNEYVEIPFKKA